jgi:hypothetical protein
MLETKNSKKETTVTAHIMPGEAAAYEKKLWRALWTRLLATVQSELKAESEAKK